jgi:pyruvate dehydrogenase E2 component (dihydrolipoamide acetyltransferase)
VAVEVVMPRLGWTMETGSVITWHKQPGELVRAGETLLTVQSDKAATEVEAVDSGRLYLPPDAPPPGKDVPIGTVLAYLLAEGETAPAAAGAGPPSPGAPLAVASPEVPHELTSEDGPAPGPALASPGSAVAPVGAPESTGPAGAAGAAAGGRRAAPGQRVTASPRARRAAAALGLDWEAVRGTGRTGRVVERDVQAAAAARTAMAPGTGAAAGLDAPGAPPEPVLPGAEPGRRMRFTPLARRYAEAAGVDAETVAAAPAARVTQAMVAGGIRQVIARRLGESARTTVAVTLTTEADATELAQLRRAIAADREQPAGGGPSVLVPSYTDLLARIVALALADHPPLNASWTEEGIVQHPEVHIGIAVDTERGLLVPVIRNAGMKSVDAIARESADLIARARAGRCEADALRGGTFTITNLGMYDIDAFTPVINLPECAILGVGRVMARPVVVDEASERIAVRRMMALSLTFDHRVVDGAPAARFLQRVKQLIESPYLWLTR